MRRTARQTLERVLRSERGSVLAMTAAAMPVMLGAAGLATDTVQWMLWQRQLQQQADSSAIAGAYAYARGSAADAATTADEALLIDTDENAKFDRSNKTVFTNLNTVTEDGRTFQRKEVTVGLQVRRRLPFSGLFMATAPVVRATARAGVVREDEYCLITLGEKSKTGIRVTGNAKVDLGCGMATNAAGVEAVVGGGSMDKKVITSNLSAVGRISGEAKFQTREAPESFGVPQPDPFADKSFPKPPGCAVQQMLNARNNVTVELPPGCYADFDLGNGDYRLVDGGTYWIDGNVKINAQASLRGKSVTLILSPTSTIDINGGATVDLSAPTSGPMKDILIFQPKQAGVTTATSKLNGGSSFNMTGAIYLPNGELQFNGGSGTSAGCVLLVADSVDFSGNADWKNNCDDKAPTFAGIRVRLLS